MTERLDDATRLFMLQKVGLSVKKGITLAVVKTPSSAGDKFVIIIERDTSRDDLHDAWAEIAGHRDWYYRDTANAVDVFSEQLVHEYGQPVGDRNRPGHVTYGDLAEGYNRLILGYLRGYLNRAEHEKYAADLVALVGKTANPRKQRAEYVEISKERYLDSAMQLLMCFCKQSKAKNLLDETVELIRQHEYNPAHQKPITKQMVIDAMKKGRRIAKRSTAVRQSRVGKSGP